MNLRFLGILILVSRALPVGGIPRTSGLLIMHRRSNPPDYSLSYILCLERMLLWVRALTDPVIIRSRLVAGRNSGGVIWLETNSPVTFNAVALTHQYMRNPSILTNLVNDAV